MLGIRMGSREAVRKGGQSRTEGWLWLHGVTVLPPHLPPPHPEPWIPWIWKRGAFELPFMGRRRSFRSSCTLKDMTQRAGGAARSLQQLQAMRCRQQLLPGGHRAKTSLYHGIIKLKKTIKIFES